MIASSFFSGILADLLDILGETYNFTWSLDKDPNNDWGTEPKTGQIGWKNATWGGNLGEVRSV